MPTFDDDLYLKATQGCKTKGNGIQQGIDCTHPRRGWDRGFIRWTRYWQSISKVFMGGYYQLQVHLRISGEALMSLNTVQCRE